MHVFKKGIVPSEVLYLGYCTVHSGPKITHSAPSMEMISSLKPYKCTTVFGKNNVQYKLNTTPTVNVTV